MAIAQALQQGVETTVSVYATSKSAALAATLTPIALTGVTIYLFIIGWAIARGEVHNSLNTLVWKVFKIALVSSIALGALAYQQYAIDFFSGIEGIFTNAMGGSPNIGALIDTSIVPMETITGQLYQKANASFFPDFRLLTAAVLCTFGQVLITIAALIPLLVAKVTIALLLAVGPAFVLLALWPATQRFTEAWLTATLAATMTVVVIAVVVAFLPAYIQYYANQVLNNINNTNIMQDVISLVMVIVVLAWIAWKASELAASLVGGSSLGNPAQAISQVIMNRLSFGGRSSSPPSGSRPTQNVISHAGGTRLAQQNVITNLNRSRR